jgi:SAM-dependent methyltransferase
MEQLPIDQSELDARIQDHTAELLRLWWAEQGGAAKDRDLQVVSCSIPFPQDRVLRTIDLGCGPGDLGRAIAQTYPAARLDFVDRDPFLLSICRQVNQHAGLPGTCRQLDLNDESWSQYLRAREYDVVAAANAIHWLSPMRAEAVFADVYRLLDDGGAFLFAEPAVPEPPFAPGFEEWKTRQPPRYQAENWKAFWGRANALLGYNHISLLGSRADSRIGDGMTASGWIDLAKVSGFQTVDVLWRDADGVIIAAQRT